VPNATPETIGAFADAAPGPVLATRGFWRRAVRLVRNTPAAGVAVAFLALLSVVALAAPLVSPFNPSDQLDIVRLKTRPPSLQHWFGTDVFSRDVFSRVVYGARVSLSIAFLAAGLAAVIGTTYGAVAGYVGGVLDNLMMRVVDAVLSIPRILLLLFVVAWWNGLSVASLVLLFGLTGWFAVCRLVRAEVLLVREREFITAARALGVPPWRILARHIVPQVVAPVFVAATLAVGNIIVVEAGLSYLGRGVAPPNASWGNIILDGHDVLASGWWISFFPGLALVSTVLAVNVVAERLQQALDPQQVRDS
jgi:peptide/nickel transport system permease protein